MYPNKEIIKKHLTTHELGRNTVAVKSVTSTNDLGKELALSGAAHGTLIICAEQTNGRGRRGRAWLSNSGSLCMSIILRPKLEPKLMPRITVAVAVAVNSALQKLGVPCLIKWPNDILANGKKICGILSEGGVFADGSSFSVCGIGVNVNDKHTHSEDMYLTVLSPDSVKDITKTAISIIDFTGKETDREVVAAMILNELEVYLNLCANDDDWQGLLTVYGEKSCLLGKNVKVHEGESIISGIAKGLDEIGRIVVCTENGEELVFNSGDVSLRSDE